MPLIRTHAAITLQEEIKPSVAEVSNQRVQSQQGDEGDEECPRKGQGRKQAQNLQARSWAELAAGREGQGEPQGKHSAMAPRGYQMALKGNSSAPLLIIVDCAEEGTKAGMGGPLPSVSSRFPTRDNSCCFYKFPIKWCVPIVSKIVVSSFPPSPFPDPYGCGLLTSLCIDCLTSERTYDSCPVGSSLLHLESFSV